jgi:hypothetical protein
VDADLRPPLLGLRLAELRLGLGGVHAGELLPGGHEVALVGHDVGDPPGDLGGDVDLRRLDAAVAAGEPVRQPAAAQPLPGDDGEDGEEEGPEAAEEPPAPRRRG